MRLPQFLIVFIMLMMSTVAFSEGCANCCECKGGIQYCDSSAGRYVCGDGDYSSCYCTRRAVMDLQKIQGCCLWQGGVFKVEEPGGLVICNSGGVSEMCSLQFPVKAISLY